MSEPIHIGWETATEKSFALDCFHDGTEHKFDNETKYKIVAHKYKEITDADDEAQGLRDWEWYIEVFKKMSKPILEKGKSYVAEVETYGEGYRRLFLHMPGSNFSALEEKAMIEEKDGEWFDYIDNEIYHDFNEDLEHGTLEEIFLTLIGHSLGFEGCPGDYKYVVVDVMDIDEIIIENDNLDELEMSFKLIWERKPKEKGDE